MHQGVNIVEWQKLGIQPPFYYTCTCKSFGVVVALVFFKEVAIAVCYMVGGFPVKGGTLKPLPGTADHIHLVILLSVPLYLRKNQCNLWNLSGHMTQSFSLSARSWPKRHILLKTQTFLWTWLTIKYMTSCFWVVAVNWIQFTFPGVVNLVLHWIHMKINGELVLD